MPGGDGTGPFGNGPVGRGLGPCGAGQYRGRGFGFGRGRRFWNNGQTALQNTNTIKTTAEDEKPERDRLEEELRDLEKRKAEIEKRLQEVS